MIPIVTKFLKYNGFLNKSICADCKNKKERFNSCKYKPKLDKDYCSGEETEIFTLCKKRNKNGNCPFFEEKHD